jgi:hypothetical protein
MKIASMGLHHLAQHGADLLVGEWQDPLTGVDDPHLVQPQGLEEAGSDWALLSEAK